MQFFNVIGFDNNAALNESPSEKEGKSEKCRLGRAILDTLNESPSEKEGKLARRVVL